MRENDFVHERVKNVQLYLIHHSIVILRVCLPAKWSCQLLLYQFWLNVIINPLYMGKVINQLLCLWLWLLSSLSMPHKCQVNICRHCWGLWIISITLISEKKCYCLEYILWLYLSQIARFEQTHNSAMPATCTYYMCTSAHAWCLCYLDEPEECSAGDYRRESLGSAGMFNLYFVLFVCQVLLSQKCLTIFFQMRVNGVDH